MICDTFLVALYKEKNGKKSWLSTQVLNNKEWIFPVIKNYEMIGDPFRLITPNQINIPENAQYFTIYSKDKRSIKKVIPKYDPFFNKRNNNTVLEFISYKIPVIGTKKLYFNPYSTDNNSSELEASWTPFKSQGIDLNTEISSNYLYVLEEKYKYSKVIDRVCVPSDKKGLGIMDCEKELDKSSQLSGKGNASLLNKYIGGSTLPEYKTTKDGEILLQNKNGDWTQWKNEDDDLQIEEDKMNVITIFLITFIVSSLILFIVWIFYTKRLLPIRPKVIDQ